MPVTATWARPRDAAAVSSAIALFPSRLNQPPLLLYAFAGDKYRECWLNGRPMLFNYPFEPAWPDGGVKWMLRASYRI